jgi:hypothetical protein
MDRVQSCPAGSVAGGDGGPEAALSVADEIIAGWAAGLGGRFQVDELSTLSMLPVPVVRAALADLERHHRVRHCGEQIYEVLPAGAAR